MKSETELSLKEDISMENEIFPGRGWFTVKVNTDNVPLGSRKHYAEEISTWCLENIGEPGVDWICGGYSCIFRVKSHHLTWFRLVWG